ncbi:MAG: hypothetical protein LM601_07555 [Candidatus Verstraetearchaeota archaeon]|nr:hypothetical protein [Candidatus Verstraetearchaeota archaeon]
MVIKVTKARAEPFKSAKAKIRSEECIAIKMKTIRETKNPIQIKNKQ